MCVTKEKDMVCTQVAELNSKSVELDLFSFFISVLSELVPQGVFSFLFLKILHHHKMCKWGDSYSSKSNCELISHIIVMKFNQWVSFEKKKLNIVSIAAE